MTRTYRDEQNAIFMANLYKKVIIAGHRENMTNAQIADELGIGEGYVKAILDSYIPDEEEPQ